jgi:hypothetical protein
MEEVRPSEKQLDRQNLLAMAEPNSALLAKTFGAVVDPSPECAGRASEIVAQPGHRPLEKASRMPVQAPALGNAHGSYGRRRR